MLNFDPPISLKLRCILGEKKKKTFTCVIRVNSATYFKVIKIDMPHVWLSPCQCSFGLFRQDMHPSNLDNEQKVRVHYFTLILKIVF